jgi:hypothetical protein
MKDLSIDIQELNIHTSEAYYGTVRIFKENCIIPFINLAIIDYKKISFESVINYFDYCYLIIYDISFFKSTDLFLDLGSKEQRSLFLGGVSLNKIPYVDTEFEVKFRKASVILLPETKISKEASNFIPIDTPNFKKNLDTYFLNNFLKYQYVSTEFRLLLNIT